MTENVIPIKGEPRRCVGCGILLGPFRLVVCESCERWERIARNVEDTKKLLHPKDA